MSTAEMGAVPELGSSEGVDRVVPKLLLTYGEASWSLGVSERTLRNMVNDGRLAAVKLGGRTLFALVDLQAVVEANRAVRG